MSTGHNILSLDAARGISEYLPHIPLDFALGEGDFALIEVLGPRRGTAFADLCVGLVPMADGQVRFLGRDWSQVPQAHADALRGHIGRLFRLPLRADTPDVASRILLARLHHTRQPEAELRAEASGLALRFGLPGLPAGPTRLLSEPDLLRAACVRAFLGRPRLVILELPLAAQQDNLISALLEVGAEARGQGAAVLWLAGIGPALRSRAIRPSHRLRLGDAGLVPFRLPARVA
ncbi:MAG TPA: ABC transporter ATP-binding protein [Stellaceae bacterium]|jgi:phospholipid/cholesterol/gamma-HCH transport system ATP-binding protein|nr:ABC transporter ATP-binding protein [Stellaceae bacterium]